MDIKEIIKKRDENSKGVKRTVAVVSSIDGEYIEKYKEVKITGLGIKTIE